MIKIENVVLPSAEQWQAVINGMRNPMNSWEKSDSKKYVSFMNDEQGNVILDSAKVNFKLGKNDYNLMKKLAKAGTDHRKFMRMIPVYMDITAPLYFFKEMDTYKVGTVCNSCSTMHKITEKPFEMNDFSCEHLECYLDMEDEICAEPLDDLAYLVDMLNLCRRRYIETKDKKYWWQIIQLLPSSYNQKRTYLFNYEVLANMYKSRKNHKLDEWQNFCRYIETLPYSDLITGDYNES